MANDTLESFRRQLHAHVESLRAAGVEWLPLGPALTMEPPAGATAADRLATCNAPGNDGLLFGGTATAPAPAIAPLPSVEPTLPPSVPVTVANELTPDQRRHSLTLLAKEASQCTCCAALSSTRTQTVFGQGEPGAEICFVGEAPGADEDAQGLPFVGAAGQLLTRIILACGFKREDVYICNILKCRPPGNRTPQPDEAANCRGFLTRQLELVQPKFIVALGSCAATNLLNTTQSLGRLRGRFHDYNGIPVLVTYHPAYLLPHRNPEKKRDVWEDMKMLLARMGREVPKKD
jgi:DNA polymerase